MAKQCKVDGCNNPVWSNADGYCRWHLYLSERYRKKLTEQRSHKKRYKIPRISKKRSEELKTYSQLIKEIDKEAKENKNWICFFCGKEIKTDKADHHHLIGREGKDLVNKEYIVLAHRKCHRDYHDKSVHELKWFMGYIERLKEIDWQFAKHELLKLEK